MHVCVCSLLDPSRECCVICAALLSVALWLVEIKSDRKNRYLRWVPLGPYLVLVPGIIVFSNINIILRSINIDVDSWIFTA